MESPGTRRSTAVCAHLRRLRVLEELGREHDRLRGRVVSTTAPAAPAERSLAERARQLLGELPVIGGLLEGEASSEPPPGIEDQLEQLERLRVHLSLLRERAEVERDLGNEEAAAMRAALAGATREEAEELRGLLALDTSLDDAERAMRASIHALHEAVDEALDALEVELGAVAAKEQRARTEQALGSSRQRLQQRVMRVHRLASEGAVVLTEQVDLLAAEVELLAPADPARRAAEAELATFLRDRTVADAVRRARGGVE